MKQFFFIVAISLSFALVSASASDLAIYSGPTNPSWISQRAAIDNTRIIMNDERIKNIFENIENFRRGDEIGYNSSLGRWVKDHTGNGQQDVLISASASTPSALYRFPNTDPNGSNIEKFIEDGNVYISVADYIFYASWENARQNVWNREAGAANIFDIPWLHFWPPGGHGAPSITMVPTKEGNKYMPTSLKAFGSDRPWHLDHFLGTDWEIVAFATGENNALFADPAVAINKEYGGIIASMWHKSQPNWIGTDPRGIGIVEFIANWLTEHGNISNSVNLTVEDGNPAIVSIAPASVEAPSIGKQLVFTLHITNGIGMVGYQTNLQFDNESLRYITSENGDYLPAGAFFAPSIVNGDTLQLLATALSGESSGNGTLATLTFEVIRQRSSNLVFSQVILSDKEGNTFIPELQNGEIVEPTRIAGDVNGDGTVNIADLVLVANRIGETGNTAADVNDDGVVNIADLVLVAGKIGTGGPASPALSEVLQIFTIDDIQHWITQARNLPLTDEVSKRGILLLERLLARSVPKHTMLMANYPNPFNPETWIPYQLAEAANVKISIYSIDGKLVRTLLLGHQPAGIYTPKSQAVYWDGKNEIGEPVASGVYFYTLVAGDFTASRQMLIRK